MPIGFEGKPNRINLGIQEIGRSIVRNAMGLVSRDSHPENIVLDTVGRHYTPGKVVHLFRSGDDKFPTRYDSVRGIILRGPYTRDNRICIDVRQFVDGKTISPTIVILNDSGEYTKSSWETID